MGQPQKGQFLPEFLGSASERQRAKKSGGICRKMTETKLGTFDSCLQAQELMSKPAPVTSSLRKV